jgi:hypothetical protein
MVVGNNKWTATKNAGKSLAVSIARSMKRYNAGRISRWSTSRASLDAAIGRVPVPYHPGSRHGQRIRIKHTQN